MGTVSDVSVLTVVAPVLNPLLTLESLKKTGDSEKDNIDIWLHDATFKRQDSPLPGAANFA